MKSPQPHCVRTWTTTSTGSPQAAPFLLPAGQSQWKPTNTESFNFKYSEFHNIIWKMFRLQQKTIHHTKNCRRSQIEFFKKIESVETNIKMKNVLELSEKGFKTWMIKKCFSQVLWTFVWNHWQVENLSKEIQNLSKKKERQDGNFITKNTFSKM